MVLRKCSVKAISLCPDAKICCTQRHPAEFAEGSECHKFNEEVESLYTNADYIRSMSDEELARILSPHIAVKSACSCYKDWEGEILDWLKKPYKGEHR